LDKIKKVEKRIRKEKTRNFHRLPDIVHALLQLLPIANYTNKL
jgi:hypothetical protein